MADIEHKNPKAGLQQAAHGAQGWARAAIMSAMLGIVLLATIPTMIGYPSPGRSADAQVLPVLGLVRGI